jgi:hypothetical protein
VGQPKPEPASPPGGSPAGSRRNLSDCAEAANGALVVVGDVDAGDRRCRACRARCNGSEPGLTAQTRGLPRIQLYIMYIIGAQGSRIRRGKGCACPVTANMSFDSYLVVSHVVVTANMSSATPGG